MPEPILSLEAQPFWRKRLLRLGQPLLLAVAAIFLVNQLALALQSPAESFKGALLAAADELRLPQAPKPQALTLAALQRHFDGLPVTLDASYWPQVAVTWHGADRSTCVEAATIVPRVEGLVVVQLEKYRSVADCREANEMTWWILP